MARVAPIRLGLFVLFAAVCTMRESHARAAPPELEVFGRAEAAAAFPLGAPQTDRFAVAGFQGFLNAGVGFKWIDLKLTGHFQALPAASSGMSSEAAVVGGVGGGLRFKLPLDIVGVAGLKRLTPYLDTDFLYARTSSLDRFAYSLALGVNFPLDSALRWRLSPVLRFLHITNPDRAGFDDRDSFLFTAGLSLEYGAPLNKGARP